MHLIITLLWIFLLGSFLWGIINIFRKGRRLHGLVYTFVAPTLLFIAIGVFTAIKQNAELNKTAHAEGFESHLAKREAETQADAERKAVSLKLKIKGFPDETTWKEANDLGIKRFEAYRLLNDAEAISQYCIYSAETNKFAETKLAELDAARDKAAEAKIWEKYDKIQTGQLDKFNSKLGLRDLEYLPLANAGSWNWHCRSGEENWDVFTPEQAAKITFDDARLAKENLEDFYITNLYEIKMPFIVNDKSLAVSCRVEELKERYYLGCYFTASGGKKSQNIIYTLGNSDDGRLLLSPLNGIASRHAKDIGVKEGARTFLQGRYRGKVYLARMAAQEDISEALALYK